MKKQVVNLSWPAQLTDFFKDTVQENFSRGKLKVFYKGETADHRFFSDSFCEELIKSLPYTPVVSYYDEEEEDFVGHATEQQILGIVDPCTMPSFEEDEDGKTWCVCDIVLYTERPDKVGDLAKKIVGHKQSLELDPNSVQYKINYDEKKHFKNIEFTAGKFVGVSVLGEKQNPAFAGSIFFSCDENFENKMKILKEYCEQQKNTQEGGSEMNLQEFMKLSWGEISTKVEQAIAKEYKNDAVCHIVDMFEDAAVVRFYYYMEGSSKLIKISYSCDEGGNIILGEAVEVRVTYEPIMVEQVGVENATEEEITTVEEVIQVEVANASSGEEVKTATEETIETPVDTEVDAVVIAEVSNAEFTHEEEKVSEGDEQKSEEEDSSFAALAESERAEFETLEKEKKISLLNNYREILEEAIYNDILEKIDSFKEEELLDLLNEYKKTQEQEENSFQRAFAFAPLLNNANHTNSIDDFIRGNL